MQTIRIGAVAEFEDRSKRVVSADGREIGVFRLGDAFYAWYNDCPHQGGPVCQGRLYSRVRENLDDRMQSHGRVYDDDHLHIVCPWHGLEFDIRTGRHPGSGALALQPAAVQIDAGEIYVLL